MKSCSACGLNAADAAASCDGCGEAAWVTTSAPEPKTKPVIAKKLKATKQEPAQPANNAAEISDTDFAEELTRATDEELLVLLSESLKPSWRNLLDSELMRRAS